MTRLKFVVLAFALALVACGGDEQPAKQEQRPAARVAAHAPAPQVKLPEIAAKTGDTRQRNEAGASEASGAQAFKDRAGGTDVAPASKQSPEVAPQPQIRSSRQAPDRRQTDLADKILAYHNFAQGIVGRGMTADRLMLNARFYQDTWRLPPRPRNGRRNPPVPPPGLFNQADSQAITTAFQEMDRALTTLLEHYGALEK